MRIVIVIPCYNEARRIDVAAFTDFVCQHAHIHLLFVNDGSVDSTSSILNALVGQMPGAMSVLHLDKNSGKAEAVRQGFLKAFTMMPEVIGFFDADMSSPLESILELEDAMSRERKDIVMAARVALLGRTIDRNPARHYAGRLFATAASIILGLAVYDTQCGAKIFRVTDKLKKVFAAPFTVRWIFDVEILARFMIMEKKGTFRVCDISLEQPLRTWVDKKGSKIRLIDFLTSGFDLIKIFFLMRKNEWP